MNKIKKRMTFQSILFAFAFMGLVSGHTIRATPAVETTSVFGTSSDAVVGSWRLTVSSVTFPTAFNALITFAEGGGVIGSAQGDVLLNPPPGVPPVATAVHGAWKRTAYGEYLFTFRQIFYNSDGTYAGGAKVRNSATLDKNGNQMSGRLIVEYYDANEAVVFTGEGTFTGIRIEAESLAP